MHPLLTTPILIYRWDYPLHQLRCILGFTPKYYFQIWMPILNLCHQDMLILTLPLSLLTLFLYPDSLSSLLGDQIFQVPWLTPDNNKAALDSQSAGFISQLTCPQFQDASSKSISTFHIKTSFFFLKCVNFQ